MIVSPRPSHPFGISVVRHNVAVICELFVADCTYPVLLDNLPIQQFPHLSWGPEFSVSSRVMRIFDALYAHPYYYSAFLPEGLPATAGK
jgi:hypothetical protein